MTVISFESSATANVATARNAASDLRGGLVYLRDRTDKALDGVRKARTLEKVLVRYAEWLGVWHRCNVATAYAMHFRGVRFTDGSHIAAAHSIRSEIQSIEGLMDQCAHWIAMPNLQSVRLNIQTVLSKSISSIDIALESCAVLEGQSGEGSAA